MRLTPVSNPCLIDELFNKHKFGFTPYDGKKLWNNGSNFKKFIQYDFSGTTIILKLHRLPQTQQDYYQLALAVLGGTDFYGENFSMYDESFSPLPEDIIVQFANRLLLLASSHKNATHLLTKWDPDKLALKQVLKDKQVHAESLYYYAQGSDEEVIIEFPNLPDNLNIYGLSKIIQARQYHTTPVNVYYSASSSNPYHKVNAAKLTKLEYSMLLDAFADGIDISLDEMFSLAKTGFAPAKNYLFEGLEAQCEPSISYVARLARYGDKDAEKKMQEFAKVNAKLTRRYATFADAREGQSDISIAYTAQYAVKGDREAGDVIYDLVVNKKNPPALKLFSIKTFILNGQKEKILLPKDFSQAKELYKLAIKLLNGGPHGSYFSLLNAPENIEEGKVYAKIVAHDIFKHLAKLHDCSVQELHEKFRVYDALTREKSFAKSAFIANAKFILPEGKEAPILSKSTPLTRLS